MSPTPLEGPKTLFPSGSALVMPIDPFQGTTPEEVRAFHMLGQRFVCVQVLRELSLDKVNTGIIIVEPNFPILVLPSPGLHEWSYTLWHVAGLVCLMDEFGDKLRGIVHLYITP